MYFRLGPFEFGVYKDFYLGKDRCASGCYVLSLGWLFLTILKNECRQSNTRTVAERK